MPWTRKDVVLLCSEAEMSSRASPPDLLCLPVPRGVVSCNAQIKCQRTLGVQGCVSLEVTAELGVGTRCSLSSLPTQTISNSDFSC